MKKTAITIDFWQTIMIDPPENMAARNAYRAKVLCDALRPSLDVPLEKVVAAYRQEAQEFNRGYEQDMITPPTRRRLERVLEILDARLSPEDFARVLGAWENAIAAHGVVDVPDIRETLGELRRRFPLAIICDTGYSSGHVLRKFMEERGLIEYFSVLTFSDEQPHSKPHRSAFESTVRAAGGRLEDSVHIGDTQRTDIAGAQACGMKAILFIGGRDTYLPGTTADAVARTWKEIPSLIDELLTS